MSEDDIPVFESYRQLPIEGDAVFRVGENLVRFTARRDPERPIGWTVTTADDGYEGFLQEGHDTFWNQDGPEPVRAYSFRYRGPEGSTGPVIQFGTPVDVSAAEFRKIFFGDHD
ncbi:hypothetical protein AB0O14_05900 [Microbacterium foliorum]